MESVMKWKSTFSVLPLAAGMLLSSAVIFAHTSQRASSPADGAVVEGSPAVITIGFQQPMRITHATLQNTRGKTFSLERSGGIEPRETFKGVPETLPPGEYRLEWRGLAEDGHVVSGHLKFTVR